MTKACFLDTLCPLENDCPGDANGDKIVNLEDFNIISSGWLWMYCHNENQCCMGGDFNGDGHITQVDAQVVLDNWLNECVDEPF